MRLLIAFDGSDGALAAIDDLRLAGLPERAEALVLSAVDAWAPPPGSADADLPGAARLREQVAAAVTAQHAVADRGAAELRKRFPGWTVRADACADSPAWAVIHRAEGASGGVAGGPADLIVVGSRGHGAIKRALLGSVAQKVVTQARCSVRIARPRTRPAGDPPRILIGVDGSANSRAAVDAVASRAWPPGARVLIACYAQGISGLELSSALGLPGVVMAGGDPLGGASIDTWATKVAAESAASFKQRCPSVEVSTVVRISDPKYAIVDEAAHWGPDGADCVFVGATGVRGIERFLLGSVSTHVAMHAPCSVEVVRTPKP